MRLRFASEARTTPRRSSRPPARLCMRQLDAYVARCLAGWGATPELHTPGALATVALAEWRDIVAFAINVAGITVQRVGADPPRRNKL